jgi:hypothetical protein
MHNKDGSAMRLFWHRSSSAPLEEKNGKNCTHFPIRHHHHPKTAADEEANSNMDMDISYCCSIKKNLSGYSFLQRARLLLHATLHALVLSSSSSSSSSFFLLLLLQQLSELPKLTTHTQTDTQRQHQKMLQNELKGEFCCCVMRRVREKPAGSEIGRTSSSNNNSKRTTARELA